MGKFHMTHMAMSLRLVPVVVRSPQVAVCGYCPPTLFGECCHIGSVSGTHTTQGENKTQQASGLKRESARNNTGTGGKEQKTAT